MQKELDEMKAKLEESKKFEWKYPNGKAIVVNSWCTNIDCNGNDKELLKHGRYRLSKQYAEHSLKRNRVANRLEALVEQIEPDYVVPEIFDEAWYILYSNSSKLHRITSDSNCRTLGTIYMSKETATKICELLNSGEIVL